MRLRVRSVAVVLAGTTLLLTVTHFVLASRGPQWRLFHLDAEGSLGTAFSSFQGLYAATLAAFVAIWTRDSGHRWIWWGFLSLGVGLYAVDEVAKIHEGVASLASGSLRDVEGDGMAGTAALGVIALPFFLLAMWGIRQSAERGAAALIILGLALFWLGGFGIEELEYLSSRNDLPLTEGLTVEDADFC